MRMEASGTNSDAHRGVSSSSISNIGSNSRRHGGVQLSASNLFRAPLSTLLEYSGILRTRSNHSESDSLINSGVRDHFQSRVDDDNAGASSPASAAGGSGEVSIRIIGAGEQEHDRVGTAGVGPVREVDGQNEGFGRPISRSGSAASVGALESQPGDRGAGDGVNGSADTGAADGAGVNNRESSYQRYDIQQAARWIEQIIPFSLLLLIVFIRQHLQGFFVTILIAAVMFKSNDIVKKQTALKGERKISVLLGVCLLFSSYVIGFYWWYRNDDLLYPLLMLPPKAIPPFWHAIFIIMVNDTLVRQAAMVFKCFLLMYYKNSRGRNYRKQGQLLTLVEYLVLLYRALLPAPVWYRFFLNKEYGSLFSSLMTGLYLTFKLTSVVEKVQSFFTALKALSRKEIHYGVYATPEQVNAAGDLCAICQEKMHTPILLRCKHLFCEDCVSEWFERERTCPLCRALVKPADLKSFGDGSTSLFFQLF
ncbi:PREDICTED: RING finger and transmembrane domain-containing protein 1 [Nicotiana attenuata]|uniref:Erad-associated e3 ubiquitin-protein ligase hrd1b n=1 Tax=Nicotiana attenuata TaxID=49451 RepID=A0A1J6KWM7_NICAT|nr:PREDICTED: RING finger and transmembrane domain-containing protein 1 [Nicotiana attenuata]OIT27139.1 erad-associated e3 ubiquitin-protein ligase hrd1b [Nicotiana attenuata]